jgi:putative aminopeptidase FrvX
MPFREALWSILSRPTAPFREGHVIATISDLLDEANVPYFEDPIGNLIVGVDSERRYRALVAERSNSKEPVRVFIAHMDHPGFHGTGWNAAGELEFRWHGGSPTQHLEGAAVWLAARDAFRARGVVVRAELAPSGRLISSGTIRVVEAGTDMTDAQKLYPDGTGLYGGFDFGEPLWQDGDLLYTKAADDLVGCTAIVTLARELFKKQRGKSTVPFLGLLTRAEEVGWLGAVAHFELGWLERARREILCVSLETSRALPGAEIGKGPIVRLGDRFTVFDAARLRVFSELAEKTLPGKHQRRIMDGGSCEASAATVYGFRPVGISVPLGNYHNQSFEGGPLSRGPLGPAPEFVHLDDVEGLIKLCRALMKPKLPWASAWDSKKKELRKSLRSYRALLRSAP